MRLLQIGGRGTNDGGGMRGGRGSGWDLWDGGGEMWMG